MTLANMILTAYYFDASIWVLTWKQSRKNSLPLHKQDGKEKRFLFQLSKTTD